VLSFLGVLSVSGRLLITVSAIRDMKNKLPDGWTEFNSQLASPNSSKKCFSMSDEFGLSRDDNDDSDEVEPETSEWLQLQPLAELTSSDDIAEYFKWNVT